MNHRKNKLFIEIYNRNLISYKSKNITLLKKSKGIL